MSDKYSVLQLGSNAEDYIRNIQKANDYPKKYYGKRHLNWLEKALRDISRGARAAFGAFVDERLVSRHKELASLEIVGSVITNRVPNPEMIVELKSFMVNKKAIQSIGETLHPGISEQQMKGFVKEERFKIRKEIFNEVERYCIKNRLRLIEVEVPTKNKKLIADMEGLGFESEPTPIYPHYSPTAPMQKFQKTMI